MTAFPNNRGPNEGDRISRLELGRYAAGELEGAERERLEARLREDADAAETLREIEAARAQVRPLDVASLRSRAAQLVEEPQPLPAPANTPLWQWLSPLVALAALFLLVAIPLSRPVAPDGYIGVRGGSALKVYVLDGTELSPYDDRAVGADDVLGFKVDARRRHTVVVLSVDGQGQVSVFWPEEGSEPEPLGEEGVVALPGSIVLDDASGPEVFVAVFDATPAEARTAARSAFQSGGIQGLLDWAGGDPDVDAVVVKRR